MKVKINKVTFDLVGKYLFTHICECLINDDQIEYNRLIKKLTNNDIKEFIKFLVFDDIIINQNHKAIILNSLIGRLKLDK